MTKIRGFAGEKRLYQQEEPKTIADLRTLSIGERIRLVEDIWDSIAVDQVLLPLTDEQRRFGKDEIQRDG